MRGLWSRRRLLWCRRRLLWRRRRLRRRCRSGRRGLRQLWATDGEEVPGSWFAGDQAHAVVVGEPVHAGAHTVNGLHVSAVLHRPGAAGGRRRGGRGAAVGPHGLVRRGTAQGLHVAPLAKGELAARRVAARSLLAAGGAQIQGLNLGDALCIWQRHLLLPRAMPHIQAGAVQVLLAVLHQVPGAVVAAPADGQLEGCGEPIHQAHIHPVAAQ
mmetsp:Transcript_61301/g.146107  ORF Transcript_61301/g.146107 Transcript_61301/m.146107 type:complete len:213 (-) Transcript_61301:394-1032(-)